MLRSDIQELFDSDDYKKNYENCERFVNLGWFFFSNIRTVGDKDESDPQRRSYSERIYDKTNENTWWSEVLQNTVMLAKPLFHAGKYDENGKCVSEPALCPEYLKEAYRYHKQEEGESKQIHPLPSWMN